MKIENPDITYSMYGENVLHKQGWTIRYFHKTKGCENWSPSNLKDTLPADIPSSIFLNNLKKKKKKAVWMKEFSDTTGHKFIKQKWTVFLIFTINKVKIFLI